MTAPVATARGTPAGIKLVEGFHVKITLARNTTVSFWEKMITPPGMDGGEMIDITDQFNTAVRTKAPRTIYDFTEFTITAAYDPNLYNQAILLINAPDTITFTYPDGSTIAFYGCLRKLTPQQCEEGAQPTMEITISPTNYDPIARTEAIPVITSVSGT